MHGGDIPFFPLCQERSVCAQQSRQRVMRYILRLLRVMYTYVIASHRPVCEYVVYQNSSCESCMAFFSGSTRIRNLEYMALLDVLLTEDIMRLGIRLRTGLIAIEAPARMETRQCASWRLDSRPVTEAELMRAFHERVSVDAGGGGEE